MVYDRLQAIGLPMPPSYLRSLARWRKPRSAIPRSRSRPLGQCLAAQGQHSHHRHGQQQTRRQHHYQQQEIMRSHKQSVNFLKIIRLNRQQLFADTEFALIMLVK
jgi:DNA-binding TFAR19-related protein (PDSD5 family)